MAERPGWKDRPWLRVSGETLTSEAGLHTVSRERRRDIYPSRFAASSPGGEGDGAAGERLPPAGPASPGFLRKRFDLKTAVLAVFVASGIFKAHPMLAWLPVDITLIAGVLSLLFAVFLVASGRTRLPMMLGWYILLFMLFAVPVAWTMFTPYAAEKVWRLFTVTFCAGLLPVLLIREPGELRRFLNALSVVGVALAIDGGIVLLEHQGSWAQLERLTGGTDSTIGLGRAVGVAGIWVFLLAAQVKRRYGFLLLALLGLLIVVLLGSGSRGPLLGFGAAILLVLMVGKLRGRHMRGWMMVGAAGLFVAWGLTLAPDAARLRMSNFFAGDPFAQTYENSSIAVRADAIRVSLTEIGRHPEGLGWGGFDTASRGIYMYALAPIRWPHNFVLETLVEAGWAAGICFVFLVLLSLRRSGAAARWRQDLESNALFAVLVFQIVNSLVSGDLNGNRMLFCFMSLGLAATSGRGPHEARSDRRGDAGTEAGPYTGAADIGGELSQP